MFLEKLEIQGFKSFASKNMLVFPGMLGKDKRGITAVVGPNGSGKSNVADAVRWALGEQSMKTLRGKKSEDVIFSGSDKKGKLGMAEVSLFLNNEDSPVALNSDGKAPVESSEIVLTRRLYRNGDSEYLINNSRARLFDIQMLLARAKFGQKTYSVIGQGMVEGFLNTSLSERKEFFDEATGVKQFQIKRDDSLNKLMSSHDNLEQAEMLISEIEPRLKSLTRQVNKLKQRGEIEQELRVLQLNHYTRQWREINGQFTSYNSRFLELEKQKFAKDKKLEALGRDLEQLKPAASKSEVFAARQEELRQARAEKEAISRSLARLEALLEVKLEQSGQFDAAYILTKKGALDKDLAAIKEEIETLNKNIASDREAGAKLAEERARIDREFQAANARIRDLSRPADGDTGKLIASLEGLMRKLESAELEGELDKVKAILREIREELTELVAAAGGGEVAVENWQEAHEAIDGLSQAKEAVIAKINDNNLRLTARGERVKLLTDRGKQISGELAMIEGKLSRSGEGYGEAEKKEKTELEERRQAVDLRLESLEEAAREANAQEERERNRLFSLQQEMQDLQNEINSMTSQLNDLKVNSTRFETKLEDLEIEIRAELGGLKEVRDRAAAEINETAESAAAEAEKGRIRDLKRQLELIGGIDPQIEQEYNETKERYDFLFGQVSDLRQAIGSLEKIIKELDLEIKERFDKEFRIIEKKFDEYFKILFNGGTAKIIKVMAATEEEEEAAALSASTEGGDAKVSKPENGDSKRIKFLQKHNATGLAGIEIQATPPGKKIKSIAMLSGGERALTAIGLICAIISANPSPFVVLDEVDAALDEANSERLAKILDELSHKTQFIVITHNRASMRRASVLYGVTMGDDGASKLLSVKLEEAAKTTGR